MKKGHAFTIEPMVNQGSYKDFTWKDDWTSSTIDGMRSAQFEHTMVITDEGVEILTARLPTSPHLEILPEGQIQWTYLQNALLYVINSSIFTNL